MDVTISNGATDNGRVCWTADGSDITTTCTSGGTIHCQTRNPNQSLSNGNPGDLSQLQNRATKLT